MCRYYNRYNNSRFNRKKRKWFAAFSFTSGLTMFILLNQRRIVGPMDLEMVEDIPQLPTNSTITDFFLGEPESKNTDTLMYPEGKSEITTGKMSMEPEGEGKSHTQSSCCTDDFHQSPYVPDNQITENYNPKKSRKTQSFFKEVKSKRMTVSHQRKWIPLKKEILFRERIPIRFDPSNESTNKSQKFVPFSSLKRLIQNETVGQTDRNTNNRPYKAHNTNQFEGSNKRNKTTISILKRWNATKLSLYKWKTLKLRNESNNILKNTSNNRNINIFNLPYSKLSQSNNTLSLQRKLQIPNTFHESNSNALLKGTKSFIEHKKEFKSFNEFTKRSKLYIRPTNINLSLNQSIKAHKYFSEFPQENNYFPEPAKVSQSFSEHVKANKLQSESTKENKFIKRKHAKYNSSSKPTNKIKPFSSFGKVSKPFNERKKGSKLFCGSRNETKSFCRPSNVSKSHNESRSSSVKSETNTEQSIQTPSLMFTPQTQETYNAIRDAYSTQRTIGNLNKSITNETEIQTPLIIPNVSVTTNISFVTLKNQILSKLLQKFDLAKMFSNSTYRKTILSRDLSQWDKLLKAPDDSPWHTFEPAFLEIYDWRRTSKPANLLNDNFDLQVANDRKVPVGHMRSNAQQKHFDDGSNLQNGNWELFPNWREFPNSLRDIPKQRIRDPIRITTKKHRNSTKQIQRPQNITKKQNYFEQVLLKSVNPNIFSDVIFPFQLDYSRPAYFPFQSTTDECSNFATRFLVSGTGKLVPLVSFPGSGNSWLRYIVEAATGIFTGTIYEDDVLALKGFWGERDSYLEGTTLLQKTHSLPILPENAHKWEGKMILGPGPRRVVLLIRNPYEAIVSFRHFHAAGHTGFARRSAFTGKGWDNFTEERANSWFQLNKAWLQLPETKVIVMHYEILMQNLDTEVHRLLKFLGIPVDYGRLSCLLRYPEGKLRRPRYPKHLQGYQVSSKVASIFVSSISSINQILARSGHATLPTQVYSFLPATHPS